MSNPIELRTANGFGSWSDEANDRAVAIQNLISTYAPDLQTYLGLRPMASGTKVDFPCVMIDVTDLSQDMQTTGKTRVKFRFELWFFVFQANREDLLQRTLEIAEFLKKLFSNNALGDLGVANPPTNQFKVYNGFWINAEILRIQIGKSFLSPFPNYQGFARGGVCVVEVEDQVIK